MAEQLTFPVTEEFDKMNALTFLKQKCNLSSRMITRLKREKNGILMDDRILRTIDLVEKGKTVIINLPDESSQITPVKGELKIVYEDKYLLIVDKPPLMPVHPVKQHQNDTLANIVAYYQQKNGDSYVFRAINRLDRDTSGLVLITKDRYCANKLKKGIHKEYYALCHGKIESNGTVCAPIGLHEDSKMLRHVLKEGTPAITHYEVIKCCEEFTFLKLVLETGKTHQIRCHMSSLGHPLLGDDLYGGIREKISRQALHCGSMAFEHPVTGDEINVKCDVPYDMISIIKEQED